MPVTARLAYTNLAVAAATQISASSYQATFPPSFLRDQISAKPWRSKLGWNIVTGRNDKIDFNRGGVKAATVAAGNYATGAELAAAIVTALEAADATPAWACAYDVGTFKFTISTSAHSFTLLFGTGTNLATSIGKDMGYAVADTSSATSQVAGNVSYKSREWLKFNLGGAAAATCAIAWRHNLSPGTITLRGNSTDAWSAPAFSQALSGNTDQVHAYFASQSYQWWELLIDDVQTQAGFSELGVAFIGVYAQPSVAYIKGQTRAWGDLSLSEFATHGAQYHDERPKRRVWPLFWEEVPEADRVILEDGLIENTPKGKDFFFAFDAVGSPDDIVYGFMPDDASVTPTGNGYHNVSFAFAEEVS